MSWRDPDQRALDALRYMAMPGQDMGHCVGYAWGVLARIAGMDDLPLPFEVGPPKPEHAAAFEPWDQGGAS